MTDLLKKRVLIVDDSFIMRKIVRELVESDPDFEVADTAEDGRIALQKVRECKPDLVLLDIEMPEMTGLETLRRLGLRSKSKVVILSSLGQEGSAESTEALRLGAAAVLSKPSGSVSLDLRARKGSEIVRTMRDVMGLPPDPEAVMPNNDVPDGNRSGGGDFGAGPTDTALQDALLQALESGVLVFDSAARLIVSNAAAARLLGRSGALAPGITLNELFDEFNEGLGGDIREVLATGEALPATVTEYALPDGDWQPLKLAAAPVVRPGRSHEVLVLLDDMRREQEVKKILARTLSVDVAAKLLSEEKLNLGGALARASILFSDIRSFSTMSEDLGAPGTVEMLNEYFSFMEDILKAQGGVVDKYIGDAIMALFGVPVTLGNDADRAVKAGLDMLAALDVLNADRSARGQHPIKIGIGIGTGDIIAGNIGSPSRLNYTVIGDAVNLASRVESLTKLYGAELMVCGETIGALKEPLPARKLDLARVKGQHAATVLYQVFPPSAPPDAEWLQAYDSGLQAYIAGDWSEALRHLDQAMVLQSGDKAAGLIMERCRMLQAEPPEAWDGVWTHMEK